mgnify:CR=1 FL=1
MATIDNLNFKVILDDVDFNKRIKADIAAAKQANVELSTLLAVKQRFNQLSASDAASAKRALDIEAKRAQTAAATAAAQEKVKQAVEQTAAAQSRASAAQNKAAEAYQRAAEAQERTRLAQQRTATEASRSAEAAERVRTAAERTAAAQVRLQTEQTKSAIAAERLKQAQQQTAAAAQRAQDSLSRQSTLLKQLTTMAATYFSVQGVTRFLGSIIRVTGEFEMQRMALRNIVQDVQGADALFGKLQKLAVQSPYTFTEVTSYAKQLAAFSVPLDELYDTTKMLADVSAGLGVDMNRMILAYGQVRSAAFLRGQEVRQFTEAGVPLLQKLAEQFTELEGRVVSVGEVFDKISKREVSFEMVAKVLKDLTSEGGQFFDMQSVLSETLKGKVMKLKDAYEQMLYSIGEGNSGFFHGIVDTALSAVRNYEDLGRILKEIVIVFGTYKAGALIAAAANGTLVKSIEKAYRIMRVIVLRKMNPYALLASGAVAAGFAIYELAKRQTDQQKIQAAANDAILQYNSYMTEEISKLDTLWGALERAEKGTEKYDKAKAALLQNYDSYLSALDKEKIRVGELKGVYDRLTVAVKNSAKERFLDTVLEGMNDKQKEGFSKIAEELNDVLDAMKVSDAEVRADISAYVSGLLSPGDLSKEAKRYVDDAKRTREAYEEMATSGKYAVRETVSEIEYLRERLEALDLTSEESKKKIEKTLDKIRKNQLGGDAGAELLDWQKEVNAALEKAEGEAAKKSGNMIKSSSQDLTDYIDKLRKSYKELTESIANASPNYQKNEIEQWKKDLEGVEAVAKLLKIDLNKATFKELTTDKPDKLTEQQKAQRAEIQATVQMVNKLKDAYEQLKAAIPESMLGEAMKALFPDISPELRDNFDYDAQLRALSDSLRLIPGEADNADKILANMGKDATKAMTDAFEAAERFVEEIQNLTSKDFSLDGTGVAFDISKIVSDLRTKNAKVDIDTEGIKKDFEAAKTNELAMKALRVKYGEEFWQKYVEEGDKALDTLAKKEKAHNAKKAQESVNDLAKRYVSENVGKGKGIDLTDLSQKSLRQVAELRKKIKEELENFSIGDVASPQTTTLLDNAGLSLKDFGEAVKDLLNGDLDKLDDEMKEKLLNGAVSAANGVSDLGDALVRLGEASDNARLAEIGEGLKNVSGIFSQTLEGAKSGGVFGAALGFLKGAGSIIVDIFTKEAEAEKRAKQATLDYTNSLALLKLQIDETKYSSVFGEDTFGKMNEYLTKGREAMTAYNEAVADFKGDMLQLGNLGAIALMGSNGAYGALLPEIKGLESLTATLRKSGVSVWDEDGAFNAEKAKAYLDANYDIDDSLKSQIQHLIDLKEKYDEIEDTLNDMVNSLAGSLAGDMVDSFLDNFKQVGDAVDDLDSAFQNLGETILKSMLQSYVIDEILNEFEPRVKDMFKQYSEGRISAEDVADRTGALADDIRKKTEDAADIINAMIASFDNVNLIGKDSSQSSGSLSDGIKSVTEDTASLLASYINAIRADVSFAKTQRAQVLEILRSAFPSSPTLAEHLAQIQANTYNTAVATQEMLSEFRGVLAPHSEGGSGVKVVAE